MIVAVIVVRMVQVTGDHKVDMVAVRHGLVPALGTVRVAGDRRRVAVGMPGIHRDHVLVDVIAVLMVKMAVVEIVDVIVVLDRDMTTALAVHMRVLAFMNGM